LNALGRKRGPKAKKTTEQVEIDKLQRENEQLKKKLKHAEKIIDVQKKLSEILGRIGRTNGFRDRQSKSISFSVRTSS